MPVAELTEAELARWGGEFAGTLRPPVILALHGELGAGKTTLVRAIVHACGSSDTVTSPTFALVHEYAAPEHRLVHLDLYRLAGPEQLPQIGWEDFMRSPALIMVEWPERAGDALPHSARHLTLEHVADRPDVRRLSW